MKIEALSSKLIKINLTTDRKFKTAFRTLETKNGNVHYSKLNSSFETIAKATGVKMTAKVVGKNSSFRFRVKNNLN